MNYRHVYHAGNFADVLKHALLALVVEHLKLKPAPFRVIDTHAGIGRYDLESEAAQKTGEWRQGIGRLLDAKMERPVAELLAPYLAIVRGENHQGSRLSTYPGSPLIARRLIRPGDALVVNELHPQDAKELENLFARDPQTKVLSLDGWVALKSLLPPKERRGVVLVDPPFEEPGELARMTSGLGAACRRFATGTYLLWYPIKKPAETQAFHDALTGLGLPKMLMCELFIRPTRNGEVLCGTGLVILNPPYTLASQLRTLLPYLEATLAQAAGSSWDVKWLAGEQLNSS
jgi:23S rRNA (adenine2030-N6)-methyltransferase